MSNSAAFKVVTTKRPLAQTIIGYRMVLAYINRAQYCFQTEEMVQSFQGPHRMAESGDYTDYPDPARIAVWLSERMKERGITAIEAY